MKKLAMLLLFVVLSGSAWAGPSRNEDLKPAVVNIAASYLDNLSMDALASLQIIANTREAKHGDWAGIEPYLSEVRQRLPGVYFYVLPDGNYYTLTKGLTHLNLRNRGYFKALFAGAPVKGYQVYSRSTGKKSAVMAAPIMVDGKVVGALGVSVYLDALHTRLNTEIGLPADYTWFVVNGDGMILLDKDEDFIFMNALTEGPDSLKKALTTALHSESGRFRYEIGDDVRDAVYRKLPDLDWWMILARREGRGATVPSKLRISLNTFVPRLQGNLNDLNSRIQKLLADTKSNWDHEADIRRALNAALKASPSIFEALFVDHSGRIRYIEPGDYVNFEGADISTQAHVMALIKKRAPVFSAGFSAVEGFRAVDIAYPVYDRKGSFKGSLSLLIRPELMLHALTKQVKIPGDDELWIMQPDGMIIYDQDPEEIGTNIWTDPAYAGYQSLRELARKISANPRGQGDYVYRERGQRHKIIKTASWDTVSLFGREWRVVLAHPVSPGQ